MSHEPIERADGELALSVAVTAPTWVSPPVHVDFNLTNACNLACTHCHASSGRKLPDELTTPEAHAVIDELHRAGVLTLVIAGGEPFARRDAIELLSHACSLPGWQVSVVTNGVLLRGSLVQSLAEQCPGLGINISVDGSTPALFGLLRRRAGRQGNDPSPLFREVCEAVSRVASAGLETSVNFTITRATLDDTVAAYDLVVGQLGAQGMVGIKFFPAGYGKDHLELLELPYPLWSPWFARLTNQKIAGELQGMQISVPAPWEFYLPLIEAGLDIYEAESAWGYAAALREPSFRRRREIGDAAGIRELAVAPNGDVYPSVLVMGSPRAVCGNLRREALGDILATSPTLLHLRTLDRAALPSDCRGCELVSVCGGGSRARAWDATASWAGADPSCPLVRTVTRAHVPSYIQLRPNGVPSRELGSTSRSHQSTTWMREGQAIRMLRHRDGAEVRVAGRIIHCDAVTADALEASLAGDGAPFVANLEPAAVAILQAVGIDMAEVDSATT